MKKWAGLCAVVLALAGCSTISSRYAPWTMDGGYADKLLTEGRYRASFTGNGHTGQSMSEALALLRGAELCQQAGYAYVRVLSKSVDVDQAYGLNLFTASTDVQCAHEAAAGSRPVADVMAEVRAAYPAAMAR